MISILSDQKNPIVPSLTSPVLVAPGHQRIDQNMSTPDPSQSIDKFTIGRSLGNMSRFSGSCCLFQSIVSFHTPGRQKKHFDTEPRAVLKPETAKVEPRLCTNTMDVLCHANHKSINM